MRLILALIVVCAGALPGMAAVDIQEVETEGGLSAWLVEEPAIPFVALELRFRGGTSLDLAEKRGAIYLMTGLLEEGAGDLDARSFARELEALAATFSYEATDDYVSVSARFLTENRDQALDLLRQTLVNPRFDQDAVDRVRGQVLSGLASDAKDPNDIASNAFSRIAFGDHPYGSDGKGTIQTITALSRDDIVSAHQGVFARDQVFISAVGDITADELAEVVDMLLEGLPQTGRPIPGPANVTISGGETVIPFETPQSVALFGQRGIDRDDDDFFAAYLLNQVLGAGGFESRLMHEVREKRGLTYGVYSYLAPKDLGAVYVGQVSSSNDRIAEAIAVIRAEWSKLAEKGVSEKELQDAKTYLTGAYPLRFDGNGQIAGIMVGMQMQGLPIDYIANRNDKVNEVTLDDVNRVARELLDPDNLHFVVVGRPEGLE